MTTTFDVLCAMAQRLPGTVRGMATGGGYAAGATYLEDALQLTGYANDAWIGGTLLIETGILAGAVLPVTDSVQSSGRLVLSGLVWELNTTDTPAAGARYTLVNNAWPVGALLAAADEALRQWGQVESWVTLGASDGTTTSYALPSGTTGTVTRIALYSAGDVLEVLWRDWEWDGSAVVFADALPGGWTVKAWVAAWPTLTNAAGYEDEATLGELAVAGSTSVLLLSGYAMCQTFTVTQLTGHEYLVTKLRLYNNAAPASDAVIPIEVWGTIDGGDDDGKPDYTQVLYQTTGTAMAGTTGWVEADVSIPLRLGAGVYALAALAPTGGAVYWKAGTDATYTGGVAYSMALADHSWAALAFDDFMFSVSGQLEVLRCASAPWPDTVTVEFGAWYGAYALLRGRVGIPGHDQDGMVQLMNYALERAETERGRAGAVGVHSRERFFR